MGYCKFIDMKYRNAKLVDFEQVMKVRMAVLENQLSDPSKVQQADYEEMITKLGKGWVCEKDGKIIGFAIVDLSKANIWALFLLPEAEGYGVGNRLHQLMVDWAFDQQLEELYLGTDPGTRAERFYISRGWKKIGDFENGEVHLTLSQTDWNTNQATYHQ